MLTHEQMREVIREGGSVLYRGRVISRIEDLPSPAVLAIGDPAKEQEIAHSLQAQIDQLQAQLAQLQGSVVTAAPSEGEALKPKKAASKKDRAAEEPEGEAA